MHIKCCLLGIVKLLRNGRNNIKEVLVIQLLLLTLCCLTFQILLSLYPLPFWACNTSLSGLYRKRPGFHLLPLLNIISAATPLIPEGTDDYLAKILYHWMFDRFLKTSLDNKKLFTCTWNNDLTRISLSSYLQPGNNLVSPRTLELENPHKILAQFTNFSQKFSAICYYICVIRNLLTNFRVWKTTHSFNFLT